MGSILSAVWRFCGTLHRAICCGDRDKSYGPAFRHRVRAMGITMTRERISRSIRIVPYSYPSQALTLLASRRLAACIIAMSVELRKMGEVARCCLYRLSLAPN
jgi:hypothetical protein